MSKSDDNTNELESYGVWVKNSTGNDVTETPADTSDELNLDDGGLDLPDFDDSDFSDMFKDEPQGSDAGALDDFGSEDDTTLSTDELANITDGFEVEQVEAPADSEADDIDLGDFTIPDETPEATEETAADASEEITDEDSEEISFDMDEPETQSEEISFDIDEPEAQTEEVSFDEEAPAASEDSEEVSFGDDEEISLDDFMDGGFSDESVASGNNGYEPGAEPQAAPSSSDTEELSLDDFMDGDSFDSAPAAKEEESIVDEAPLDMDISFDDSADSVETEDNVSLDISADDDDTDDYTEETEAVETEEVSMDDFGSSFTAEETSSPAPDASSENINTEDVDLSDFGIDANAEETPIVQDVEEAKKKESIVDYDLTVGDENTASAPVVNEIKTDTQEEVEEAAPVEEAKPAATTVDNSLLQQIVSELSSLKDEMNNLKANLEEIKTHENTISPAAAAVAAGAAGIAAGAAAASIADIDTEIPAETEQDSGGFFSEDDGDDTIALSFDELDNIMNTAEFGDTVEADGNAPADETAEEAPAEEPVIEETVEEEIVTEEEPVIEETSVEEVPADDEIEDIATTDDTVIDESIISSEPEEEDDFESDSTEIENAISEESDTSLDDINFEEQTESFDFSDEKLEEPEIDEFIPDGNDELYENEELPDEISIPKEDDLLVESNSSDFMDSVKETSEAEEAPVEFIADDTTEEDTLDLPSELPDEIMASDDSVEETEEEETAEPEIETEIDDDIPTVDKVLGDETEEPVVEETAVEETEVEAPVEEAPASTSFAEVDNLDNNLSASNLAYLDKQEGENVSDSMSNTDLKQDIKSVLLYMDQLLENLPEDKIVEFAKSDEFVTYKKLFSELGLS